MTERWAVKLDDQELLTFVMKCLQWSNADVFTMGRRDKRAGGTGRMYEPVIWGG